MKIAFYATSLLLLTAGFSPVSWANEDSARLQERLDIFAKCRSESSALVRLDCYDQAWQPSTGSTLINKIMLKVVTTGKAWQRAMDQEKLRTEHSTAFLQKVEEGDNPVVILTTPAIGRQPPRPVLMLSCVDNITRLQIALLSPIKESDSIITLKTDRTTFTAHWFVRENGYVLESSRGLPGIEEIKRLFNAQTLSIQSSSGVLNGLTFNISQLSQTIKPLQAACHW